MERRSGEVRMGKVKGEGLWGGASWNGDVGGGDAGCGDADMEASIRAMWKVKERVNDNTLFLELPTHLLALRNIFLMICVISRCGRPRGCDFQIDVMCKRRGAA